MKKIWLAALTVAVAAPVTTFVFPTTTAEAHRGYGANSYRNSRDDA